MNILITGSAGFIGSHLAEALVRDHRIIGLDNFCDFYDPEIKNKNVQMLQQKDNYQSIKADIRDRVKLREIFSRNQIDLVIHLAAMAGVRPSIENPVLYTEVNINGTVNLLEECRKHGIRKFIFASSSSVYGNNKKVPFCETDPVDHPISPYAATKKAGELICHTYHHLHDFSMACLRFFTVYGPRQRPDLAIHKFARLMMDNQLLPVFGDGLSLRDYTYISDIIDGIVRTIDFIVSAKRFEIFNLGESRTISLNEMISTLEQEIGLKARLERLSPIPGDLYVTYADINKSRKLLGYNPATEFGTGIAYFIDWLKSSFESNVQS